MNQPQNPQQTRRRSSVKEILDVGVYWWHPFSILIAFVLGVVFSFGGIHVHYSNLDGEEVGSLTRQLWALFIGTALAYFAQVCFAFAVRTVSIQFLWRDLKRQSISIDALNAAFAATSDPLAFRNKEAWRKTSYTMALALLSWAIPITAFIAPATLNVETVMRPEHHMKDIPTLDINNPDSFQRFSYTINTTLGYQKFLGPRTIISRIGFASSTTGNMLSLPKPDTNATYEQVFHGPYVKCSNSSADDRLQIDAMAQRFSATGNPTSSELVALDYFAAIPALSNASDQDSYVQISNLTDVNGALAASNQLWICLRQYQPTLDFSTPAEYQYLTCELFNASYTTRFTWENGVQAVDIQNLDVMNPVSYPTVETAPTPDSQVIKSYSAVMSSLASQLTGSVAFYKDLTSSTNRTYSSIRTDLSQTVLLGSSDFNSHFLENHLLGLGYGDSGLPNINNTDNANATSAEYSDQRLQDMAYVDARPLNVLIPELSKNITIGLLTDPLLAPSTDVNVTILRPATVYSYQSRNLFIVYSIAVFFTTTAVMLGAFVFRTEKVSHDNSFSSIALSTSGIHKTKLLQAEWHQSWDGRVRSCLGELPPSEHLRTTQLRFYKGEEGLWGFGLDPSIVEEMTENVNSVDLVDVASEKSTNHINIRQLSSIEDNDASQMEVQRRRTL